jgi:hypothetical protein
MPLATKNGSLIVKDGQLAENCGCCGGWYCCSNIADACVVAQGIESISVSIAGGSDRKLVRQESTPVCYQGFGTPGTAYGRWLGITPTSHYVGAFALSKVSDTRWSYQYPADQAGCYASLVLDIIWPPGQGTYSWKLSFAYNWYGWTKVSRSQVTDSKSMSDMKCTTQIISPFVVCYTQPFERYTGTQSTIELQSLEPYTCKPLPVNRTYTQSLYVSEGGFGFDEKGPPPGFTSSVVEDSGTNNITIGLVITPR